MPHGSRGFKRGGVPFAHWGFFSDACICLLYTSKVKGEINVQKMKGAAVNATTAIADGVSSLLGGSKVKSCLLYTS